MTLFTGILFLAGIALLIIGADLLVMGASGLAAAFGIPTLIIGLTVVALGTSAPELAVSLQSSFNGQPDITLGNVVGSNLSNILLILGISAIIAPLAVDRALMRRDVPVMVGTACLLFFLAGDGILTRLDGAILAGGAILFLAITIIATLRESGGSAALETRPPRDRRSMLFNLGRSIVGLVLLILGAGWIVDGAVSFATAMGVSPLIVGLTIVAVGTSLPEIATSVLAGLRGERDIAVGNVVGSNIFNILVVLGLTLLISPVSISVPEVALTFDIPAMILATLICAPIFIIGRRVTRWEGGILLVYYVAYTLYLILGAIGSAIRGPFSLIMILFAIPITIAALIVLALRSLHIERKNNSL